MNRSMVIQTLETLNIRLDEIADERSAEAFRILFQLIEELCEENEKLKWQGNYGMWNIEQRNLAYLTWKLHSMTQLRREEKSLKRMSNF